MIYFHQKLVEKLISMDRIKCQCFGGMKRLSPWRRMHSWNLALGNSGNWDVSGEEMSMTWLVLERN